MPETGINSVALLPQIYSTLTLQTVHSAATSNGLCGEINKTSAALGNSNVMHVLHFVLAFFFFLNFISGSDVTNTSHFTLETLRSLIKFYNLSKSIVKQPTKQKDILTNKHDI